MKIITKTIFYINIPEKNNIWEYEYSENKAHSVKAWSYRNNAEAVPFKTYWSVYGLTYTIPEKNNIWEYEYSENKRVFFKKKIHVTDSARSKVVIFSVCIKKEIK